MATAKKKRVAKKSKKAAAAQTRGLDAHRLASAAAPAAVVALAARVADDGGAVLATYRDPLGGRWQLLAALPIDRVQPTPYQRDLSDAHVARLADAIDKLDRYLDPVVAVAAEDGGYWTPNGHHRLGAMRQLGAKAIVALVVPEPEVAQRILALNT
jgi:ParB family transcriptional regulator, chromosome partitioning protein